MKNLKLSLNIVMLIFLSFGVISCRKTELDQVTKSNRDNPALIDPTTIADAKPMEIGFVGSNVLWFEDVRRNPSDRCEFSAGSQNVVVYGLFKRSDEYYVAIFATAYSLEQRPKAKPHVLFLLDHNQQVTHNVQGIYASLDGTILRPVEIHKVSPEDAKLHIHDDGITFAANLTMLIYELEKHSSLVALSNYVNKWRVPLKKVVFGGVFGKNETKASIVDAKGVTIKSLTLNNGDPIHNTIEHNFDGTESIKVGEETFKLPRAYGIRDPYVLIVIKDGKAEMKL